MAKRGVTYPKAGDRISAERIEDALNKLAACSAQFDDDEITKYLPLYQRLETELAAAVERRGAIKRIRQRAAKLQRAPHLKPAGPSKRELTANEGTAIPEKPLEQKYMKPPKKW